MIGQRVQFQTLAGKPMTGVVVSRWRYHGQDYVSVRGDDRGYYGMLMELAKKERRGEQGDD